MRNLRTLRDIKSQSGALTSLLKVALLSMGHCPEQDLVRKTDWSGVKHMSSETVAGCRKEMRVTETHTAAGDEISVDILNTQPFSLETLFMFVDK